MGKHTVYIVLVGLYLVGCQGSVDTKALNILTGGSAEDPLGPRAVHTLFLQDVPEVQPHQVINPAILDPATGVSIQVLQVLRDPRKLPLDRFINFQVSESQVARPLFWQLKDISSSVEYRISAVLREREAHMGINVYMRLQAPQETSSIDPLYPRKQVQRVDTLQAGEYLQSHFSPLVVNGKEDLVCAPPEYALGVSPYRIETREAPGDTRIYDPGEYAPLKPWYVPQAELSPGEVREGWILCLAPEGGLEEVWLQWSRAVREAGEGGDYMVLSENNQVVWLPAPMRTPGVFGTLRDIKIQAYNLVSNEKDSVGLVADIPITIIGGGTAKTDLSTALFLNRSRSGDTEDPGDPTWLRLFVRIQAPGANAESIWEKKRLDLSNVRVRVFSERDGREIPISNQRNFWFSSVPEAYGSQSMENGFWIEVLLEDDISDLEQVWVSLEREEGSPSNRQNAYGLPMYMWQVDLFDATDPDGHASEICMNINCVEPGKTVDRFGSDQGPEYGVPALCLGESGAGITVTDIWTVGSGEVFQQDPLGGFLKTRYFGDYKDVFAAISMVPGDRYPNASGWFSLGYIDRDGMYNLAGSSQVSLFGVEGQYTPLYYSLPTSLEIREVDLGFGIHASMDGGIRVKDMFVYLSPGGPLWLASCNSSGE